MILQEPQKIEFLRFNLFLAVNLSFGFKTTVTASSSFQVQFTYGYKCLSNNLDVTVRPSGNERVTPTDFGFGTRHDSEFFQQDRRFYRKTCSLIVKVCNRTECYCQFHFKQKSKDSVLWLAKLTNQRKNSNEVLWKWAGPYFVELSFHKLPKILFSLFVNMGYH